MTNIPGVPGQPWRWPAGAGLAALPVRAQDYIVEPIVDPVLAGVQEGFSQAELDQMLAPIALYPDALLSQVLIASTYPLEIVEAARWSRQNPQLAGEDAVAAVADRDWDPSVKALVAFPELLGRLDEDLAWTRSLGDAMLYQEARSWTRSSSCAPAPMPPAASRRPSTRVSSAKKRPSSSSPRRRGWCTCPTTIPMSFTAPGGGRPIRRWSGRRPRTTTTATPASTGARASTFLPVSFSAASTGRSAA
jgi:hypothetical protein